jgi:hypothetical protein
MRGEQRCAAIVDTNVERERDALGSELGEPGGDEVGLTDGKAADDDPRCDRQYSLEVGTTAHAAAELHFDPGCRAHSRDERKVHGRAALRAIEIDDVEPARAERAVLGRELNGIDVVTRLCCELALQQAHAPPSSKIDRRN